MTDAVVVVAGTLVPSVGAVLVMWGRVKERLGDLRRDIDGKASHEIVAHQYDEIIARLDRIERRVNGV